tara:strand:+ start:2078 stop:2251 length:174 start_codon:yes stop_codon:yes gene_type:complete
MFGIFKKDPCKKIEKEIKSKYKQSVVFQRNGKLREYGQIMKEIQELEDKLICLKKDK